MAKTGALIALDAVIEDGAVSERSSAELRRMQQAGVVLALVSQLSQDAAEAQLAAVAEQLPTVTVYGLPAENAERWQWPRPQMLLRAANEQDMDIFRSWVIGSEAGLFQAAAQAGFLGGVLLNAESPDDNAGLQVLNTADSLADAPRVMIPPQGGCWHEH